jgi:hypothetical protein
VTALDDLLNSSSLVYFPASVVATWPELEPGYLVVAQTTAAESLIQLGQQIGPQGATVTQSFDDGMPDPVTSTGSNDASGTWTMDLVGRPGVAANDSTLGGNGNWSQGQGTGTSFTTTFPTSVAFWDYTVIAITVSNASLVTETSMSADSLYGWKLLGDATDTLAGTFQRTWVFGRRHYTSGVVTPVFKIDTSGNFAWVMQSFNCGRTPSAGVLVPVSPGDHTEFVEGTSAVTTHTPANVTLNKRGWNVAFFGASNAAGAWSAPSGYSMFGFYLATNFSLGNVISPFRQYPGSYAISGNTASSAQLVTGVHVAFEVRERPQLDGVGYFSPLNTDSPIYGFDRDTAPVTMSINNIAVDGNQTETTRIFTGQMTGISLSSSRTAQVTGVSKTRLLLDDAHELPTVYGWREGLETDWLAGYLLAQGGQYIGVAPSIYTRWWAPGHGSMHPYMDGDVSYSESRRWVSGRAGSFRAQPGVVAGPFVTAMDAMQTNAQTIFTSVIADKTWAKDVPGMPTAVFKDLLSQQSSTGRLSFWIRGDTWDAAPTCVDSGDPDDYLPFKAILWNSIGVGATTSNYVRVQINPNRNFTVWIGSSIVLTGGDLPADGQWHFVSFMWDYDNGVGKFRQDGFTWNTGTLSGGSEALPTSEAINNAAGGYTGFLYYAHLPIAEIQLEAGMPYTDDWSRFYPAPTAPSLNATYRPSRQPLAVIAEPTPVQGWSTLQSLAQSTLSWMRCNELDNVEFVDLDYFGETAQMTVDTLNVLDTNFNAGAIGLDLDPSKTRNVVAVVYTDTRVGSNRVPILDMNTSLSIPVGTSYTTFPLDTLTAETHGAAQWWTTTPVFQKLTALQIAGTNPIQNENVMSVNTNSDGSGTVYVGADFTARIMNYNSNSIYVQFVNNSGSAKYLANNGQQIPFLRALGYPISYSDGYATVSDPGSIVKRRERALTTEMSWVHDRTTAQGISSLLVSILAQPRPVITVNVQGDPRRVPGKLCQIVDATGTAAQGTWRITTIQHNYNGPMYTQDVTLVRVGAIGVWDLSNWDDAVWGV